MTFEEALEKLNKIVSELESGNLTLEESLAKFKEGVTLSGECKKKLEEARLVVETIDEKYKETEE